MKNRLTAAQGLQTVLSSANVEEEYGAPEITVRTFPCSECLSIHTWNSIERTDYIMKLPEDERSSYERYI